MSSARGVRIPHFPWPCGGKGGTPFPVLPQDLQAHFSVTRGFLRFKFCGNLSFLWRMCPRGCLNRSRAAPATHTHLLKPLWLNFIEGKPARMNPLERAGGNSLSSRHFLSACRRYEPTWPIVLPVPLFILTRERHRNADLHKNWRRGLPAPGGKNRRAGPMPSAELRPFLLQDACFSFFDLFPALAFALPQGTFGEKENWRVGRALGGGWGDSAPRLPLGRQKGMHMNIFQGVRASSVFPNCSQG